MKEVLVDLGQNRWYPNVKVMEAYADEKRGNNIPRKRDPEDDVYEQFYERCKRNKFYMNISKIVRSVTILQGKRSEVIYYQGMITGTEQSERENTYSINVGHYQEPIFIRELNKETGIYEVKGIGRHILRYYIPFTGANLEKELEYMDDSTKYVVKETPETNTSYSIFEYDDFKNASWSQVLEMGKKQITLDEVRRYIADAPQQQTTAQRKEQTQTTTVTNVKKENTIPYPQNKTLSKGF